MKEQVVDVVRREAASKNVARRLRRAGSIPAILYGSGKEPVALTVDPRRLLEILRSDSGVNTIFQLNMAGTDQRRYVMIHEYQVDPIEGKLMHADFLRIQMDEAIEVEVPVRLMGEATGVKLDGGILELVTRAVRVTCLPSNIPETLQIDITAMKIGENLKVADLAKSDRYTIISDPGLILAVCAAPAKEEVAATAVVAETAAAPSEPEVIKKGKTVAEGDEAEGDAKDKKEKKSEGKK